MSSAEFKPKYSCKNSMPDPPKPKKNVGMKHSTSTESMSSTDFNEISGQDGQCNSCGKWFPLLYSHLRRNKKCGDKYDMEKMKQQNQ